MRFLVVQSVVRTLENELQYQHVEIFADVFADVLQHFSSQRVLFASVAISGSQLPRLTREQKGTKWQ